MKDLEWRPASRIDLLVEANDGTTEERYPTNSVAFTEGWVFAKGEHGTAVFPAWRVVKVSLG